MGEGPATGDVVLAAFTPSDPRAVEPAGAGRDVGLHADDRLDPCRLALGHEVIGAEHVAVVRHRQRRHAHLGGLGEQVVHPRGAVEHGVLAVHMQVHERGVAGRRPSQGVSVVRCRTTGRGRRSSSHLVLTRTSDAAGVSSTASRGRARSALDVAHLGHDCRGLRLEGYGAKSCRVGRRHGRIARSPRGRAGE